MTLRRQAGTAGMANRDELAALLASGCQGGNRYALGISLTAAQRDQLLDYVVLLAKWNTVYNLTAIRDPRQMLIQHVLDSLAIVPHLAARGGLDGTGRGVVNGPNGPRDGLGNDPDDGPSNGLDDGPNDGLGGKGLTVLDVGAGAGLPGIVLAIARPDWRVTVNDVVHKKTAFQAQAKAELGLANLSVVTGRVEVLQVGVDASVPFRFDAIVSRAFAELADFVTLARHLVADCGALWAMKGVRPDGEIARLPEGARVAQVIRLNVPLLNAERHLVEVTLDAPQARHAARPGA